MLRALSDAVSRRFGSPWKNLRQRIRFGSGDGAAPVFLVGMQRSGTNMFMDVAERSLAIRVYNENRPEAFEDYRFRSPETIERLIRNCPAPTILFKPLCDSHFTDRLLERHAGAKAVWMYRRYADVANSAVRLWGNHLKEVAGHIARGRMEEVGWRGERLSETAKETVRELYSDDLGPAEGSALFWWVRNTFLFELGLHENERVLIVNYEDLVGDPDPGFRRIFAFLGSPFDPRFRAAVHTTSIGRSPSPEIAPEIARRCDAMMERLDDLHRHRRQPTG